MQKKEFVKGIIDFKKNKFTPLNDKDIIKIITPKQIAAFKEIRERSIVKEEAKIFNERLGGFIFIFFKYADKLFENNKDILPSDITKLFYLATFVNYEGCLICEQAPMIKSKMRELLDLTLQTFNAFYERMKKSGIIIEGEGFIKINENYFHKGRVDLAIKEDRGFTRAYINSIRFLYKNVDKRKHEILGNYFKIIPYIHQKNCILCWNPQTDKEDIKPLSAKDLQNILGLHRNSIRKFINELLSVRLNDGSSILIFIKNQVDDNKLPVYVNPKLFYSGDFNPEDKEKITSPLFSRIKELFSIY